MRAIYKKELRSYLTSMVGYLFIFFILLMTGIFFTAYNLRAAYPQFGVTLNAVAFIFLIGVPILTMGALAEERKQKTDQLLLTVPVSVGDIVFGKYFALVTIYLIPMLIISLYPIILSLYGKVSLPMAYVAILGFFLLGCGDIALGLFMSSITESQVIAAVLSFVVLFVCYLSGGIAGFFNGGMQKFIEIFDISGHMTNFINGTLDIGGIVYFLSIPIIFLFLTMQMIIKRKGTYSMGILFGVTAVVILVNLLVSEIPSRFRIFDFTEQKLYTISDDTKDYISGLKQDIRIYFIAPRNSEDRNIHRLLEGYEDLSGHITVEQKDPVVNPGFTARYTENDVSENSVIVESSDRYKIIDYSEMYETDTSYESHSQETVGFDGEGQITSGIEYVLSEDLPVLYILEGHGETELTDTLRSRIEKENVEIRELNLLSEEKIPEQASALMICSPADDLSGDEVEKIIAYLETGGNAMIFTDYMETQLSNLQDLLRNYGMQTGDGMIIEGDTKHYAYYPYYLLPDIADTEITASLRESELNILLPGAQGIEFTEKKRDTVKLTPLLTTSEDSYIKTDVQNMDTYDREEGDIPGSYTVGMMAEEQIKENTTRIFYFSSSALLSDSVDQMATGGNTKLFMDITAALCEQQEGGQTLSIPSKKLDVSYLTISTYSVNIWTVIIVLIIPGIFLVTGAVVWAKRRKY